MARMMSDEAADQALGEMKDGDRPWAGRSRWGSTIERAQELAEARAREIQAAEPELPDHGHTQDEDCQVDPNTDLCVVCGVHHWDPCVTCGGRGFHREDCPEREL